MIHVAASLIATLVIRNTLAAIKIKTTATADWIMAEMKLSQMPRLTCASLASM